MYQPSHTTEQRPQKESIDQIQASLDFTGGGKDSAWFSVNKGVAFNSQSPIDRTASVPFNFHNLNLYVTSCSFIARLVINKIA